MEKKKIVYVSNMCTEKKLEELFKGNYKGVPQQIQRYHRILINGLSKRRLFHVDVLSALPITSDNCTLKKIEKEILEENGIRYHYLSTVNSKIWKRMGDFFGGFFNVLKYSKKNTILIVDILDASIVLGALLASKMKRITTIGIVTDLPDYLFVIGKLHAKLANINIRLCDSYILLTEQMNQKVNPKNKKPYLVMEGHVPTEIKKEQPREFEKEEMNICFYAGILDARYGVEELVKGFLLANLPNTRLDIYGEGSYKEELKKIAKTNQNIYYKGVKQNREIVLEEKKASLLINPRPSKEEFVKYSFPSKNLEYMVSGTPTLTTCLPGMPEEYKTYVYQIKEETAEGISKILKEIFSKTKEERTKFGRIAKEFVQKNKSEDAQAEKVENFVRKIYE